MCLVDRAKNSFRGLIAGLMIAFCAVSMTSAQSIGGTLSASSITSAAPSASGLSGTLNAVLDETVRRQYLSTPVTVGWGTLGAAARAGARGVLRFSPYVGMALTASELYGWAKEQDWYNKNDGNPGTAFTGGAVLCAPNTVALPASYCSNSPTALASFLLGKKSNENATWVITQADAVKEGSCPIEGSVNAVKIYFKANGVGAVVRQTGANCRSVPGSEDKPLDYKPNTQVTDEEMAEAISSLGPEAGRKMLHDSSGKPHMFPEVVTAMNNLAAAIQAARGPDGQLPVLPDAPLIPSPQMIPGGQGDGGTSPNTTGSELPAFCEWASVVCEFIEWVKEDKPLDDVPMPESEQEDPTQDWSSGQSGGSCPAPISVSAMGEQIEFSYGPICDFAEVMNPLIQMMALCAAAFIIAGVKSNNA